MELFLSPHHMGRVLKAGHATRPYIPLTIEILHGLLYQNLRTLRIYGSVLDLQYIRSCKMCIIDSMNLQALWVAYQQLSSRNLACQEGWRLRLTRPQTPDRTQEVEPPNSGFYYSYGVPRGSNVVPFWL